LVTVAAAGVIRDSAVNARRMWLSVIVLSSSSGE
jgi:hypothetical protein